MYVTIALNSFAENLIALFVPIFLWQLEYSLIQIILFYLLWSVFWIFISPLAVYFISKKGVKHTIFYSSFFLIAYYLGLNYLEQAPMLFYIIPIFAALRSAFFWLGWHINFIEHADSKKQSGEIAVIQTISIVSNFLTPFIGGAIIFLLSWHWIYIIGSIILFLSVWPLLKTKDVKEKIDFDVKEIFSWLKCKKHWKINLSFFGYSAEVIIGRMLWPIFLFIIIGAVSEVGALISLTMIASVIVLYLTGRLSDKISKRKLIKISTLFYSLAWIGRIFAQSAAYVFAIDTYKHISGKMLVVPWTARSYDLAKKENFFEFIVAREIVFRLSRIIILPILIILFWQFGFTAFIVSFIIAGAVSLLYMIL